MAGKFHHIQFSFQICIALPTCVPNYTHWFVCMSTLGFEVSPRRPFIANSMKIILANS
jgi:hypothetical protein